MAFGTGVYHFFIEICIAIAAEMLAGVVMTDVNALHAAADGPLCRVFFYVDFPAHDLLDDLFVDAGAVGNADFVEVDFLGAGLDFKAVPSGGRGESGGYLFHQLRGKGGYRERLGVALGFFVEVEEADDYSAGVGGKLGGQLVKAVLMPFCVIFVIEKNRVVAPDNLFLSYAPGKLLEGGEDFALVLYARFGVRAVAGKGELKIVFVVLELIEARKHRGGVFRPEDDAVHDLRGEGDAADLPGVEGVYYLRKARLQAVEKPFAVKGRNVCPAADA